MIQIYAIFAHDKKDSLNGSIFQQATEYLKEKHEIAVDSLYLYDRALEIPFYTHNKNQLETNPFFAENKERFMAADRLLIVHPVYWYSVPAILKCWIDLITNFAYKYESGLYAKPLHKITKTLIINTSMAPSWYYKYFTCNTQMRQLNETFKFFGIPKNDFYQLGDIAKLTNKKYINHIKKILKKVDNLISD
ncbi:hypothetical protein GF322_04165 [Candidatus Dependentiae bacterium]|nr:hypothetical protein [Candidatus Dependentiae bacterium]